MTFNSLPFFVFFAAVLPTYWMLKRTNQNRLLLVASYVFYGWWDARFLLLLVGTTIVDFVAVQRIEDSEDEATRRKWMIFSVAINLMVLAFFKYFGFFVDSASSLVESFGLNGSDSALEFLLPVGISFYVFHEISYAVDVYRRRVRAERDFVTYAVYIAFFPQLVAGPITRAAHMLPQFRRDRVFPRGEALYSAGVLILTGLFKKVVLADSMAPIVNDTFASPENRGFLPLAVGVIAFSIQIYGDFAGYTDIARGVARLFGIDIPRNFEQPYLSRNITEFWRTWHISLSSFLHDYLYVPLGGNRAGKFRTYYNLIITMVLGGLWHGASWAFVFWGTMHGVALAVHRALRGSLPRRRLRLPKSDDLVSVIGTFLFVSFLWIFFRSESISDAFSYIGAMGDGLIGTRAGAWKSDLVLVLLAAATMFVIDIVDRRRRVANPLRVSPMWFQGALAGTAVVSLIVWSGQAPTPFIYFQF